ncbi:MAG TPA: L-2-hydroxyglutarate oxidase [Candidatus Rubrimentiphilum sp.]|nr:L-2-hydroxyglutarate oxidase [Candidatus Rubrimentiphilum sp.]
MITQIARERFPHMYDVAVVGAGIIGLATGSELLQRRPGLKLAVLDKEADVGRHQTSHNSGVIHSGIYYAPGSLKARLCQQGRHALLAYCDSKNIEYRLVGKLIVATEESELPQLMTLWERGKLNGIEDLQLLDAAAVTEREPHVRAIRAIFSPSTAIVDYGSVAQALAGDIRESGGEIQTGRTVEKILPRTDSVAIETLSGAIQARHVITCAGLQADRIARMTGGKVDPKIVPFRGDYLILKPEKRYLVNGNVYPVPDPNFPFLGVHFTPRMNGDVWLGPNAVLAFSREGYTMGTLDPGDLFETMTYPGFIRLTARYASVGFGEIYRDLVRGAYVRALQRYVPELQKGDTVAGPSGVRAQALSADGTLVDDFVFESFPNGMHVRNAPSPGATSSFAIAGYIVDEMESRFRF